MIEKCPVKVATKMQHNSEGGTDGRREGGRGMIGSNRSKQKKKDGTAGTNEQGGETWQGRGRGREGMEESIRKRSGMQQSNPESGKRKQSVEQQT